MIPGRVLHATRVADGGVAVVVSNLTSGFDRKKYEPIVFFDTDGTANIEKPLFKSDVEVLCSDKSKPSVLYDVSKLKYPRNVGNWISTRINNKALDLYLSLKDAFGLVIKEGPRIRSIARAIHKNKISLLHVHGNLRYHKPEIIAARVTRIPCILHIHTYPKLTSLDKLFSKLVDHFIFVSKDLARYHSKQGIRPAKASIVHNGISLNKYSRSYNNLSVRKEFNLSSDARLIGIVGRIDWWKGHEYFIQAISKVTKKFSNLKAIIVGGFEDDRSDRHVKYFNNLLSLITSLNLDSVIIFTGHRNDVPRLMAAMDVVVHASSEPEPFGLVVIEGMAAGKPVVATEAGGVIDIVENGVTGLLVPPKDAEAMARAILQVLSNKSLATRLGMKARQRVAEGFTVERQVLAVQRIYDTILEARKRQ